MGDEKARRPVYCLKSPSWPDMCNFVEFPLIIDNKRQPALFCCHVLICMKFTSNERLFNIQRNAACALTLKIYYAY